MPGKQPLLGERLRIIAGRVEYHLDDSFDIAIHRVKSRCVHAKTEGNGRPDLIRREFFALNLARFDDILGQGAQMGLAAQVKAKRLHLADQSSLVP